MLYHIAHIRMPMLYLCNSLCFEGSRSTDKSLLPQHRFRYISDFDRGTCDVAPGHFGVYRYYYRHLGVLLYTVIPIRPLSEAFAADVFGSLAFLKGSLIHVGGCSGSEVADLISPWTGVLARNNCRAEGMFPLSGHRRAATTAPGSFDASY